MPNVRSGCRWSWRSAWVTSVVDTPCPPSERGRRAQSALQPERRGAGDQSRNAPREIGSDELSDGRPAACARPEWRAGTSGWRGSATESPTAFRRMYCQYSCMLSAFHFFLNCSPPESFEDRPRWNDVIAPLAGVLDQLPVEHVANELLPVLAAHAEPHALDGPVVKTVHRGGRGPAVGGVHHAVTRSASGKAAITDFR